MRRTPSFGDSQGELSVQQRLEGIERRLERMETKSSPSHAGRRPRTRSLARWGARAIAGILVLALAFAATLGIRWGVEAQGGSSTPAPGVLNYQGQLTDAGGNPLDSDYDVTFSLYDVSEGGTALWAEAHTGANAVAVSSGLFSTLLGSIQPIPGDVMASSPLYLGISVGSDTEMTPRQPVSSVAYALMANDVADDSITTAKIASGAVTTQEIAPNAVTKVVYSNGWNVGGTERSITSTTWAFVGTLSGTFTTSGGDLLIIGGPTKMKATACNARYSVALDGDSPPGMCTHDMPDFSACTGFRFVSGVPAGQHTVRPVANNNCATTVFGTYSDNPILVLELKR